MNSYNPRTWGVKYEPVSVMIYEHKYHTVVKNDYGCIPHCQYSFIGASPDGINVGYERNPEKYGRMLEIKNIFNRDIDGIPIEDYWIQMQIQMECCNLMECDFLETRFKEYLHESEFYLDDLKDYRGVILFFLPRETERSLCVMDSHTETKTVSETISPIFQYMPLYVQLDKDSVEQWIREKTEELQEKYLLYEKIYWYLDEMSCVLVKRNSLWFENALPTIKNAWDIVEKERDDGYEHRAPQKKRKISAAPVTISTDSMGEKQYIMPLLNKSVCLIKLDENGNVV